jgi:hypothetical protein
MIKTTNPGDCTAIAFDMQSFFSVFAKLLAPQKAECGNQPKSVILPNTFTYRIPDGIEVEDERREALPQRKLGPGDACSTPLRRQNMRRFRHDE